MTHEEATALLRHADITPGGTWADLGAGTGTFTRALAELLGSSGTVHAMDQDKRALTQLQNLSGKGLTTKSATVITQQKNFTKSLDLKNLDGILLANALHFVRDQRHVLENLSSYLKPDGKLVIIEYELQQANPWVPFPLSFARLKTLATNAGLPEPVRVMTRPSSYHREMYVAVLSL
jgi:tRNA A58 N-methylase Trm61